MKKEKVGLSTSVIFYPILFVLIIWVVFWVELRFAVDLNFLGIHPRELKGLRGVLLSPLLHGDVQHLLNNSLPLFLLSMALFYFYPAIKWNVLIFGTLLTGLLTWTIAAKGGVHIGASGVIYMLVSFLFFKGVWSKNYRLIALALVVVFMYGSLIWGVFPAKQRISWEGHLSGFISGVIMVVIYRSYKRFDEERSKERPPMSQEEAEFLKHFDENGNFIPSSEREENKRESAEDRDANETH